MKHPTRLLTLMLATLIAASSCGSVTDSGDTNVPQGSDSESIDTSETTPVSEVPVISDDLPDADYGGYTVRVLMRNSTYPDWIGDMFSEAEDGDVLNDAIYRRNRAVCERFNVEFELIKSSNNNYETDAVSSIVAGDDAYDIIVPHARAAFVYAEQGLCLDWKTQLTYVDLDKPWWDQDAKKSFDINGKLFTMIGDISYQALAQTDCMMFNKKLFDKYNEEYPYQKVLDNKWTFDEFSRIALLCSDDLNGDGVIEPDKDLYGYATYIWVGPMQALTAGGGRIVTADKDGGLALTINSERNVSIYEDYFALLANKNCYLELNRDSNQSVYDRKKVFSEGRALMMDGNLNDISYLRDMKDDFGIVPWPKYDTTCEKYYTNVDSGTNLFLVPITNPDPERISVILEALCAEGYRSVIPAYYEVALQKKYTRDDLSAQMLDIIKDGRVFDIGYYYCGGTFGSAGYNLANSTDRSFSSYYAKNEKSVNAELGKKLEKYGK